MASKRDIKHMCGILLVMMLFAPIELSGGEQPPDILIIGDALNQNLSRTIAAELKGVAKVVFPAEKDHPARNSTQILQNIEDILGKQEWDLIYINVGLTDLIHRAPGMQSFRVMPRSAGGIRATPPDLYEANLQAIIKRLTSTGSKVIWGSTTPTTQDRGDLFEPGSEIAYNAIAEKIMRSHGVPIIDLHTHVSDVLKDKKASAGNSPFETGKVPLHVPILAVLVKELGIRLPERVPAANKKD